MTQAGERMDARYVAGWSFSGQACFSLLFNELGVLFAQLSPPPTVRRPGEAVDERVDRVPCIFLSLLGALRCLMLARRIGRVLCKAHVQQEIWVLLQAVGNWRPFGVWEPEDHRVYCLVLGLDEAEDRDQNQRDHIW